MPVEERLNYVRGLMRDSHSERQAELWLKTRDEALGGVPMLLIRSDEGFAAVVERLGC